MLMRIDYKFNASSSPMLRNERPNRISLRTRGDQRLCNPQVQTDDRIEDDPVQPCPASHGCSPASRGLVRFSDFGLDKAGG